MNHLLVYGVPGTGKSTLASALAKDLRLSYLELDAIRPKAQLTKRRDQESLLMAN